VGGRGVCGSRGSGGVGCGGGVGLGVSGVRSFRQSENIRCDVYKARISHFGFRVWCLVLGCHDALGFSTLGLGLGG
jgi:hypothetical protein